MIAWLKSVFGRRGAPPGEAFDLIDSIAAMIAAGFRQLESVGLRPFPDMRDDWRSVSRQIAERRALTVFIRPPTEMDWALMALRDAVVQPFSNAVYLGPRHDATTAGGIVRIVSDVVAIAQSEWPILGVESPGQDGATYLDTGARVKIALEAAPEVSPFELARTIGFDWSLIARLNERLPPAAQNRFAATGGMVVYLSPAQIDALNALSGCDFSMAPDAGAKVATQ